ncbi:MAG: zinc-ribbon domain-containing protein [Oscillochloridaceae bacterium umkhey_bin13]
MSDITCPSCGQTIEAGIRFCPSCGTRIADQPPPAPVRPAPSTVRLPGDDLPPPSDPAAPPPPFDLPPNVPPLAAETPPLGDIPPSLPPSTPYDPMGTAAPPPEQNQGRKIWLLVGGGGCLIVVLLVACVSFAVLSFGQQITSVIEAELNATPQPTTSGGGGVVPIDSPLTGSSVLLREDFNNPANSVVEPSESPTSRYAFEDGGYVIEVKVPETIAWSIVGGPYEDLIAEVEIFTDPADDIAAAGLIFHYQDADNFYLFSVAGDGTYALEVLEDDQWVTLIDWTPSEVISETRNTMRVATQGDQITLFINGVEVDGINDGAFTSGQVGIALTTFADSTGRVRFDNLVIARNQ